MNSSTHRSAPLAIAAILVVMGGCQSKQPHATRGDGEERRKMDEHLDNIKLLAGWVETADSVVLYEGLSRRIIDDENLLEEELKKEKVVNLHGYPFYAEPLQLTKTDAENLTTLFKSQESFDPYSGPKRCDGFHPDYCIVWHVGEYEYRSLACFFCGEMKIIGPDTELHFDIGRGADGEIKQTLQPYRHRRSSKEN